MKGTPKPRIERSSNEVATSVAGVVAIREEAVGGHTAFQSQARGQYLENQKARLREWIGIAQDKEKQFFEDFRLSGTPKKCLEELQRRISVLRENGMGLTNHTKEILDEIMQETAGMYANFSSEELIEPLTELFNRSTNIIVKENETAINKAVSPSVGALLNQVIEGLTLPGMRIDLKGFKETKAPLGEKGGSILNNSLRIVYEGQDKNKKPKIKVEVEEGVDKLHLGGMKKKIVAVIEEFNKQNSGNEIELRQASLPPEFYTKLKQIILKYTIGGNQIKNAVSYQFDTNINKYDIRKGYSTLAGFLGELEANVFLSILCGQANVVPTGALVRTGNYLKGKAVTIDSVINGYYGFQIKNYVIRDETISFDGKNKEAGVLLGERMELEDIMSLFSAYQYNQPIETAQQSYQSLYKNISSIATNSNFLNEIFSTRVDKLIGLSNQNSAENDSAFKSAVMNGQSGPNFNSFFYITGRIVPASSIFQSILDNLDDLTRPSAAIAVNSTLAAKAQSDGMRYQKNSPTNKNVPTRIAAANKIRINWEVRMNLRDVINKAMYEV